MSSITITLDNVEWVVNTMFPNNTFIFDVIKEILLSAPDMIAILWLKFRLVCKKFNSIQGNDLYRNLASIRACRLLYESQVEFAKAKQIYYSYVKCRKSQLFICSLCGSGIKHQNRSGHKITCPRLLNERQECQTCNMFIHPIGGYNGRSRGFCPLKFTNCNYCDKTNIISLDNLLIHHDKCGSILDKICFYCSKKFMRRDYNLHLTVCKDKYRICDICKEKILVNNELAESLHRKNCEDFMKNEINKAIIESVMKILPCYLSIYNNEIFPQLDMNLSGATTTLAVELLYESPDIVYRYIKLISKRKSSNPVIFNPGSESYLRKLIFCADIKIYPFMFKIDGQLVMNTAYDTFIVYNHVTNNSIDENNPKSTQILELEKNTSWPLLTI